MGWPAIGTQAQSPIDDAAWEEDLHFRADLERHGLFKTRSKKI